ncbi:hypothetical protein POM88_051703 [Heracleum sosnowskyi]|uniref:DUF6598 domain-containing protein n=1 Tax=Heracleum sosnowskyi TaxID=360622 RepID=A0AAD8H007_9APIA|nr:hypothetical protein POM88_051703 [Heracleum sosnowskyi]
MAITGIVRFLSDQSPVFRHPLSKFKDLREESSRDFSNISHAQDFSNIGQDDLTVDELKIVSEEQLVEKALDITFQDDELTKKCREVSDECLDDVAEPVDVVEEGGDDVYVDEKGGVLDKNTLELNTTTLPKVEHKMYVSPDILVRCEPLIEILYAKVFTNADASLDVYGDIRILDLEGSKNFVFYERGRFDSPQHICSSSTKNNFLQLQSPKKIPTFNEPLLVVDIKNVDTGVVVARGQKPLLETTHHPSTPNDYEKLFTLQFEGDAHGGGLVDTGARVELQCIAFTFGVCAQVEMFLYKDDDSSESQKTINEDDGGELGVEVFGLICAKCHPSLLAKGCYENHMFNVIQDEHEWVGLGTQINLFKNLVAVPAYSQLEISLDLSGYEDDEFSIEGTACFQPTNGDGGYKDIRGVNGYYVRVYVTWCEPSNLNKRWCEEDMIDGFCLMPHSPGLYASHLLEVFSLFIARPNEEEVSLYGSVKILDYRGWCTVFSYSKNEPYFLSRGCNLLPLQGPDRALQPLMFFLMEIDLRDIDGHVNIKGFVNSCVEIDERQRPWFDKRFCAVVKLVNEKSFAAVNYTIFSFAVEAIMEVNFLFKGGSCAHVKIYGDVIASYDKLSYLTNYDAEFFQRVLFTRKKANFLEVEDNYQLPRYVVAVPMTCSLLTKVNLSFQTNLGTHRVGELVKFQIGEPYRIIKSDFVDIRIDVDWKGLPYV